MSARVDEVRVDTVGEVGGFLVGRTPGTGSPQEFDFHEFSVGELVVEFVDDGIDAALPTQTVTSRSCTRRLRS